MTARAMLELTEAREVAALMGTDEDDRSASSIGIRMTEHGVAALAR